MEDPESVACICSFLLCFHQSPVSVLLPPSQKRESLLGFIQTMKEVFGNCVGELHSRLHIVFIGCEEDVSWEAGCVSEHTGYRESENIKLCPPL